MPIRGLQSLLLRVEAMLLSDTVGVPLFGHFSILQWDWIWLPPKWYIIWFEVNTPFASCVVATLAFGGFFVLLKHFK